MQECPLDDAINGNGGTGAKHVTTYRYTIILDREPDGGFHAYCPALKGCHSQGDALDEAAENMREAIGAYLESVQAHGDPILREDLLIKPVEVAILTSSRSCPPGA